MSITVLDIRTVWEEDDSPDTSYLYQPEFRQRWEDFHDGKFGFVGCYAVACFDVLGVAQEIRSAGLWGVESDSSEEYLREIEAEQMRELRAILGELGIEAP